MLLAAQKAFPHQLTVLCDRLLQQMFSDTIRHHIHPFSKHRCVPPAKTQISPASETVQQSPELHHDCFGQAMLAATVNTSWLLFRWSSVPVAVRARGILNVFNVVFLSPSKRNFGKVSYNPPPPRKSLLRIRQKRKLKIFVAVEELLLPIPKTLAKGTRSMHVTRNA